MRLDFLKPLAEGTFTFTNYTDGVKTGERKGKFYIEKVRSNDFIIITPDEEKGGTKRIFCELPKNQKETTTQNGNTFTRSSQTVDIKPNGYTRTAIDVTWSDSNPKHKMYTLEASFIFA